MANGVGPDEMAHYETSHLDLHCLHKYLFLVYQAERAIHYGNTPIKIY